MVAVLSLTLDLSGTAVVQVLAELLVVAVLSSTLDVGGTAVARVLASSTLDVSLAVRVRQFLYIRLDGTA